MPDMVTGSVHSCCDAVCGRDDKEESRSVWSSASNTLSPVGWICVGNLWTRGLTLLTPAHSCLLCSFGCVISLFQVSVMPFVKGRKQLISWRC